MTQNRINLESQEQHYLEHQSLKCSNSSCKCNSSNFRHCPIKEGHTNEDANPSLQITIHSGTWIQFTCWSAHKNMRPAILQRKVDDYLRDTPTLNTQYSNIPTIEPATKAATPTTPTTDADSHLTVKEYLSDRKLSEDVAKAFKLTDTKAGIRMPYENKDKLLLATKYRYNDEKKFKTGDKANHPYGLRQLDTTYDTLNIVEGESDTHALWDNRADAGAVLGSGGSNHKIDEWDREIFKDFSKIKVWLDYGYKGYEELDAGAKAMADACNRFPEDIKSKIVFSILPDPCKDISQAVQSEDSTIMAGVKTYTVKEYIDKQLLESFKSLQELPDKNLIPQFRKLISNMGLLEDVGQIIFHVVESAISNKPLALAIKGASSSGKNHHVKTTFRFFPDDVIVEATTMSPKALVYDERDYKNKLLYKAEAGFEDPEYLKMERNLLSEGKIIHSTVYEGKSLLIEKAGPTGLITTTTNAKLYHDNETRVLHITIPSDKGYLNKVAKTIAHQYMNPSAVATGKVAEYVALFEYNKAMEWTVEIPFADAIAGTWGLQAPEQIRDFAQLMELIKSSARMNFMYRDSISNEEGNTLIADVQDYENVRVIANQCFSESLGRVMPQTCVKTFEYLKELAINKSYEEYFTINEIVVAGTDAATGEPYKHRTSVIDDVKRLMSNGFVEQDPAFTIGRKIHVKPIQTTEIVYKDILPTLLDLQEYSNIGYIESDTVDSTELDKLYPPEDAELVDEFNN